MSVDYYALLGVPKFCSSQDEIRRAYLAQARFFHPDAGNVTPEIAHQKMQELNAIYLSMSSSYPSIAAVMLSMASCRLS